jgi:hypothetical protein
MDVCYQLPAFSISLSGQPIDSDIHVLFSTRSVHTFGVRPPASWSMDDEVFLEHKPRSAVIMLA